jgi:hypothetical protein
MMISMVVTQVTEREMVDLRFSDIPGSDGETGPCNPSTGWPGTPDLD